MVAHRPVGASAPTPLPLAAQVAYPCRPMRPCSLCPYCEAMLPTSRLGVVVDVAIVLGFLVIGWFGAADTGSAPATGYRPRDELFAALLVAATVPGLAWRRWPTAAFLTALLALTTLESLGYNANTSLLILLFGAYWVSSSRPLRAVRLCSAAAFVSVTSLLSLSAARFTFVEWLASVVSLGMVFALGRASRLRGDLADARAQAVEEAALRRAGEERLRVSDELHDIVGHSLGIIAVQAGVGRHLMERDPRRAAEALDHIADVSRRSLDDMRSVVATLREGGADFEPLRGLDDLRELAESTRRTGLTVTLTLEDGADAVPRQAGAAVYRVARESLTNVIRHAAATRVDIVVAVDESSVELTVVDDGSGALQSTQNSTSRGHGISVMRERVEALGGSFTAAPRLGRGFRVCARLPVQAAR